LWTALRRRPDVIEGHYLVPTALITAAAARISRRPYVLYAHGSDLLPPRALGGLLARAIAGAAEIHTNSEDSRDRLEARFPGETAEVIPVGVDMARFPVGSSDRPAAIAYVGNLDEVKGPDVLLRALARIKPTEWRCRVAGVGPLGNELIVLANSLRIADRLEWLGAVSPDAVGAIYRDVRVAVVPSRRDALGQTAIEALASGTPVVVSAVGGLQSIPTAACGSVVPPDDPVVLAAAIEHWLEQAPNQTTVTAARARAEGYDAHQLAARAAGRLRAIVERNQPDD
jgi:glycosyltransferase involved in cell wall biosynthesis